MYKQIILMRSDLDMGKGKIAAQCAHAVVSAYKKALANKEYKEKASDWERSGMQKVVLKVQNEADLFEYFELAKKAGIPCGEVIHDAGHTQIDPGTVTCFATLPWDSIILDKIFGRMKLL